MNERYVVAQIHCADVNDVVADAKVVKDIYAVKCGKFKSSMSSLKIFRLSKTLTVKTHSNINLGYAVAQIHCTDVNHVVADVKGFKDFFAVKERQIQISNVKPQNFQVKQKMNRGYAVAQINCADVNHVIADANGVNHVVPNANGVKDFRSAKERQIQIFNVKPQNFQFKKKIRSQNSLKYEYRIRSSSDTLYGCQSLPC